MENTLVKERYTFEEYWQMELESEQRHEFIDGQIIAMPEVTQNHNTISLNLVITFVGLLEEEKFKIFVEGVKLQIESKKDYTYPNFCVAIKEGNNGADLVIQNPVLVVEILSEGTRLYDQVDKFLRYKKLPSLQYYMLVDTERIFVNVYCRQPDGQLWESSIYTLLTDAVSLPALSATVGLQQIYRSIFSL